MPRPNEIAADARALYGPASVRPAAGDLGDGALWVDPAAGQALYQVQSGNWVRVGLAWRGPWDPDISYGIGELARAGGRLYVAKVARALGTPTLVRQDTFARANQSGWGTASDGSAWAVLRGPDGLESIVDSAGLAATDESDDGDVMGLGAVLTTSSVEMLVRWQVTVSVDDTDGPAFSSYASDGSILVQVQVHLSGALGVSVAGAGLFHAAGLGWAGGDDAHAYWTRWRHAGGVVHARSWADGAQEPQAWDVAWDSGQTISAGIVGVANIEDNASTTLAFAHLSAWTLTPAPADSPTTWDLVAGA